MPRVFVLGLCFLATGCATGAGPFGGGSPTGGGDVGGAPAECGNGVVEAGEACDGDELAGAACDDLDFVAGELSCSDTCELDTADCIATFCDNGVLDEGEDCDGTDLGTSTCISIGFAGGPLTCAAETCLVDAGACKPNLEEDFEGDVVPEGFLTDNWSLDPASSHSGTKSIRAGDIDDLGSTSITITLTYEAAGTIAFWHREQSESCCDLLRFFIDGVQKSVWSTNTWQEESFAVDPGVHTMEWRYTKDGSTAVGADTAWVDDIVATGGYLP